MQYQKNTLLDIDEKLYYKLGTFGEEERIESQSSVRYARTHTPARYIQIRNEGIKDTAALKDGRLKHIALLESDKFLDVVKPLEDYKDFKSKGARDQRDDLAAIGKYLISLNDFNDLVKFHEEVWKVKDARELLTDSLREKSILWELEGLNLKSRIDIIKPIDGNLVDIADFKNISFSGYDVNNENLNDRLMYYVKKYGIFIQAGCYRAAVESCGYKVRDYKILFVEKDTNLTCVKTLSPEMVNLGFELFKTSCQLAKQYIDLDTYPSFTSGDTLDMSQDDILYFEQQNEKAKTFLI